MSVERYQQLLSEFVDGQMSPEEYQEFAEILRTDQQRVAEAQRELEFVDLLEQSLNEERSFPAFLNGLETRVRAEETCEEFIAELLPKLKEVDDQKIVPFPSRQPLQWAMGLAAAAAVVAAGVFLLPKLRTQSEFQPSPIAVEWEANSDDEQMSTLTATGSGKVALLDGSSQQEGPVRIAQPGDMPIMFVAEETNLTPGQSVTMERVPGESGSREVSSDGIRSYLIELDAGEAQPDSGDFVVGTITFPEEILGLNEESLELADKIEFNADGRSLELKIKTGDRMKLGKMRVFVREDPDQPKGTAGTQPDGEEP